MFKYTTDSDGLFCHDRSYFGDKKIKEITYGNECKKNLLC